MPERLPVAALPMYDWPEVRWANDAIWRAVAERLEAKGLAAPPELERGRERADIWTDPDLLLAQTCAWPFITHLHGRVRLVATPAYDADGCAGPFYSSFLLARAEDPADSLAAFRGRRFAVNGRDSLSGYVALRSAMRAEALAAGDAEWVETGSHRASLLAVAEGAADLAAIDAVCWALAGRHEAEAAARLKIVGRTPLRPGLPFVTAAGREAAAVETLRSALAEALASDETLAARQALFLAGIAQLAEREYSNLAGLDPDAPTGSAN